MFLTQGYDLFHISLYQFHKEICHNSLRPKASEYGISIVGLFSLIRFMSKCLRSN